MTKMNIRLNLDAGCKPHYAFCLSSKRLERLEKLAKNKKVFKKHTEAITARLPNK